MLIAWIAAAIAADEVPADVVPRPYDLRVAAGAGGSPDGGLTQVGLEGEGWFNDNVGLGGRFSVDRTWPMGGFRRGRETFELDAFTGVGRVDSQKPHVRGLLGAGAAFLHLAQRDNENDDPIDTFTWSATVQGGAALVGPRWIAMALARAETWGSRAASWQVTALLSAGVRFGPAKNAVKKAVVETANPAGTRVEWSDTGVPVAIVEPGSFMVGSASDEVGHEADEKQRLVRLDYRLAIGVTEVPQALWREVTGKNPSSFKSAGAPVERVSWREAVLFCNALSERDHLRPAYRVYDDDVELVKGAAGWRLPTADEWEIAARAGSEWTYSGATAPDPVAWFLENSGNHTHVVGSRAPNAWGLVDFSGNVAEWVWDLDHKAQIAADDPFSSGEVRRWRVARGGSWRSPARDVRVADRRAFPESHRGPDLGLRVVRTVLD